MNFKFCDAAQTGAIRSCLVGLVWLGLQMALVSQASAQDASYYAQPRGLPSYTNPCGSCTTGPHHPQRPGLWKLQAYGGQPYRESDKRRQLIERNRKPGIMRFSSFWPAPFHSSYQHGIHGCRDGSTCQPRARDLLDGLAYFKLVSENVRQDSGYCGPECDPYGYLGSSQSYLNQGVTAPSYVSQRYPPITYPVQRQPHPQQHK